MMPPLLAVAPDTAAHIFLAAHRCQNTRQCSAWPSYYCEAHLSLARRLPSNLAIVIQLIERSARLYAWLTSLCCLLWALWRLMMSNHVSGSRNANSAAWHSWMRCFISSARMALALIGGTFVFACCVIMSQPSLCLTV